MLMETRHTGSIGSVNKDNFVKETVTAPNLVIHLDIESEERERLKVKQVSNLQSNPLEEIGYYWYSRVVKPDMEANVFDFFSDLDIKVLQLKTSTEANIFKSVVDYIESEAPVFNFSNDKEIEAKEREELRLIQKRKVFDVSLKDKRRNRKSAKLSFEGE